MRKIVLFALVVMLLTLCACGSTDTSPVSTPAPTPLFTNLQGTPTTICAEEGCDNYIASSGDTAYCPEHSSTCFFCEKFTDKDVPICDECIREISAKSEAEKQETPSSSISFTNAFGTSTTRCAHPGCNNYIASSGDTNCCTIHSNRCLNCGKYIDEDASYCMSCIEKSLSSSSGNSNSSTGKSDTSSSSSYSSGKTAKCNYCNGTGKADGGTCPWCNGSGKTYDNAFNDLFG